MSVVRRTCGRPRRTRRPSVNFLACVHSRGNFVRMLIFIVSRSDLKLGYVGSKTRSLGQILEKTCVHSRENRFDHKCMKLC